MKVIYALLFFVAWGSCTLNSQNKKESNGNDYITILAHRNQVFQLVDNYDTLMSSTFEYYLRDMDSLLQHKIEDWEVKGKKGIPFVAYNNAVLNKFFAEKITSYATNTGDLSFSNYFINANTSEKTLIIGKSFRMDNAFEFSKEKRKAIKLVRPVQKVENLLSIYIKSDLSNGFSTLYSKNSDTEEYNFNSNIAVGGKYTWVINGSITPKDKKKIKFLRDNFVKKEIQKEVAKYDLGTFNNELDLKNIDSKNLDISTIEKNKQDIIRKKYFEFYELIVDKELEYAKKKSLIQSSLFSWLSIEGYYPLTQKKILYSIDKVVLDTTKFGNWKTNLTYNVLGTRNFDCVFKESSIKLTLQGSLFNTNTFIANNKSPVNFQGIIKDNGDVLVEGSSTPVFIGDYNSFTSGTIKGEVVILLVGNSVGLSSSVEETLLGEVKNTNWKLGVPFSLKDKEDKPIINFELQWREINKSHSIGLSVGYNFGKFVQ
jgi:hypothetical protein